VQREKESLAGEGGVERGAANTAATSSMDFVVDATKLEQTLAAALA
jgi:hypothetical protein